MVRQDFCMRSILLILTLLFLPQFLWAQSLDYAPGELIVKFKPGSNNFAALGKAASHAQIRHNKSWDKFNLHHFSMKTSDSMSDVLERLRNDPTVEYAEPDYYVYQSSNSAYSATDETIGVVESWDMQSPSYQGDVPVIAILDSGLDINHEVFQNTGRLWKNPGELEHNGYDDDRNGYHDDLHGWNFIDQTPDVFDDHVGGHGTHVAGIALGVSEAIESIDPTTEAKVKIMPLKFLDREGRGKTSHAIEAIYYAVDNGARVISNSWGGNHYSAGLHEALNYAYNRGVLIVAAAGNSADDNDIRPMYPASYDIPSMISVAATAPDGYGGVYLAQFSNYGEKSVHIAAPGVEIYSTQPGNSYGPKTGTSMATPFVAGLGAILMREAPGLTGYQIKEKILSTGKIIKSLEDFVLTSSQMDAQGAMAQTKVSNKDAPYQPYYEPHYQTSSRSLASFDLAKQGFGCGTVKQMYTDQNGQLTRSQDPKPPTPALWVLLSLPILFTLGLKYKYRQHERRAFERKRINMPAQIITERGYVLAVQVHCWSAGGAGIQLAQKASELGVLDQQNLTLRIKSKLGNVIVSTAKVVRQDQEGYLGLQFEQCAVFGKGNKNQAS